MKQGAEQISVAMIAAMDTNGVIGRDNQLPWHLPGDLKFFKSVTMGKPIIMGRNTYESIGRPLPGRCNIIVSRNPDYAVDGAEVVDSLGSALQLAAEVAQREGVSELMIIGGGQLYRAGLPMAQRLYITRVQAEVDGDASFPEVDWGEWQELDREDHCSDEKNPYDYSFLTLQRVPADFESV